jgi:hypothetical protein
MHMDLNLPNIMRSNKGPVEVQLIGPVEVKLIR